MRVLASSCVLACVMGSFALAQQPAAPISTPVDQARVFITDSNSWETRSGGGGAMVNGTGTFASSSAGGARPQTAEVIKTFGQRCPQVIVNNRPSVVDYVVELEHEGGKGMLAHKDKVAVFVRTSGDSIFSKSTLSIGGSVQDACAAILAHWGAHAPELKAAAAAAAAPVAAAPAPIVVQAATPAAPMQGVTVEASVPNCDIEVDGEFAGNTPSTITLAAGKHSIAVKKKGFEEWTRTMTVSGGMVRLNADMTPKS